MIIVSISYINDGECNCMVFVDGDTHIVQNNINTITNLIDMYNDTPFEEDKEFLKKRVIDVIVDPDA